MQTAQKKTEQRTKHKTVRHYLNTINAYERRRSQMKIRLMNDYGWNGYTGVASNQHLIPKVYMSLISNLGEKIRNLRKSHTVLKKKQETVRKIGRKVEHFFNIKLNGKIPEEMSLDTIQLAKWILSKYVLELGTNLNGRHISNYLNCRINNPSMWRTKLTRSFETNPFNKKKWDEFNIFIKD